MRNVKVRGLFAIAGAIALAGMTIAAAPISSSGDNADVIEPVEIQIIDRTFEDVPVDKEAQEAAYRTGGSVETAEFISLPDGVDLELGQAIQVNYRDGVVLHQSLFRACSVTASVSNPTTNGVTANASHTYGLSAGCPGSVQARGMLSSFAWPLWHARSNSVVTANPGATSYFFTAANCANGGSTTWHAETLASDFGNWVSVALSVDLNLACNPG